MRLLCEHRIRALRGDTKLSEQTRKKIQQTAKEKGYIRNNLASSLRSGASHIIAVIVNDIRNQHFTSMISEIELFLRQAGYDMMILCTQLEEQGRQIGTQMVHVAISQSVDGILYFPYSDDKPVVAFLEQSGVPFVLVDRWIPGVYADLVRCDDVSRRVSGRQAPFRTGPQKVRLYPRADEQQRPGGPGSGLFKKAEGGRDP